MGLSKRKEQGMVEKVPEPCLRPLPVVSSFERLCRVLRKQRGSNRVVGGSMLEVCR
jgi:hypothetical protein